MGQVIKDNKVREKAKVLGLDLNLLRPKIFSEPEALSRRKLAIRLLLCGLVLGVWISVFQLCANVNLLSVALQARKSEKNAVSAMVAAVRKEKEQEPQDIRETREELSTQVDWAERLFATQNVLSGKGEVLKLSVSKNGTVEITGRIRDIGGYGLLLESVRRLDFVSKIRSALLTYSDSTGFIFQISVLTATDGESL